MSYKNIIFDLGGVIINLDFQRASRAFFDLGIANFNEIYSKAQQTTLFDDFEKGIVSDEAFRLELRKYLPENVSDASIDAAWNALLLDIPAERITFLQEVAKSHRIFLLSNTNRIHVTAFTKMINATFGEGLFDRTFEKVYYSCNLHMRKPDAAIFNKVLEENNLELDSTLFIDDSMLHIEGARRVGLQADFLQLDKGETIEVKYQHLLR